MTISGNGVQDDWEHTLAHALNNNMLLDSPKGKTAYACGIAYAMTRLKHHVKPSAWNQLQAEAAEFCAAYMNRPIAAAKVTDKSE